MITRSNFSIALLPLFVLCSSGAISFTRQVAPILVHNCLTCHNPEKAKGGYQLQTFEMFMRPGKSKTQPIAPNHPEQSELYRLITAKDEDDRMPQKAEPLPASQIQLIQQWIAEGAKFDGRDAKVLLTTLIPREPYPKPPQHYARPVAGLALRFSDDGGSIWSNGYYELLRWDAKSGKLLERLQDLPQRVHAIASLGERLFVAGGAPGKSGEVLACGPGTNRQSLATFADSVLCLAVSPKANLLAAGGSDNCIHLFDATTGEKKLTIEQHADWVMDLSFNAEGTQLASASRDRSARIYDAKTGDLVTTYNDHDGPVYAVAFHPDGKQVLSAGRDKKIHIWNPVDGKRAGEIGGFDTEIFHLLVRDDFVYVCGADSVARKYSLKDKKLLLEFKGHGDWIYSEALSSSSEMLATGSYDGEVRIWESSTGKLSCSFKIAPE